MEFKLINLNSRYAASGASLNSCASSAYNRAFTLPELLVSVALGTMLLAGAVTFYGFSASSFLSMTNCVELTREGRLASDLISRDIRTSTSVSTGTTNQLVLNALD